MVTYEMTSKTDLNNRRVFEFLNAINGFDGTVLVEKIPEGRRANAKSLLGLLSLSITHGDEVRIYIDNNYEDYEKVIDEVKSIVEDYDLGRCK